MSISRGHSVEKVRFSASRAHSDENDEDYSASVNAILHKRLSVRKGKHQKQRRSSSPVSSMMADDASLLSDRRRSSAFTTSSGDTAINIEEAGISQEQIFENIRLHKEVLGSVRLQPWSIRRKMKLVQQAKEYVKKHEGQLQERLAMSKSTRDILARFHILVVKQWQHTKREMANVISQIIPWELTIKEIESQFGTVVASYFTFLRWLFWVNFVISVMLAAFVVIPEVLTTSKADTGERKTLLPEEETHSMDLNTLVNFEGVLQHSPMFYGFYSNRPSSDSGYRLPTAYFITGLVVYIYSFVATLRKMAANSRLSKLSEKDDECVFTWKLFTGWDYMIGNEETAHNRISSIILGFKEALLEEAERMKDKQNWKVVALRIFANLNMVWMLGSSVYAVIFVVNRSTGPEAESTLWRKYEITVVMTLIGTFFPIAFEGLGVLENYHPRTTLRVQLARIMALNLLNLYTLTFALFVKINELTIELGKLKPLNSTIFTATPGSILNTTTTQALITTAVLLNTTIMMPMSTPVPMTTHMTATTTTEIPPRIIDFKENQHKCQPFEIQEMITCSVPKKKSQVDQNAAPNVTDGSVINSKTIQNSTANDSKMVQNESATNTTIQKPTNKPIKTNTKEADSTTIGMTQWSHTPVPTMENGFTTLQISTKKPSTVSTQRDMLTSSITTVTDEYATKSSVATTMHSAVSSDVDDIKTLDPPRDDQWTWSTGTEDNDNVTERTSIDSLQITAEVYYDTTRGSNSNFTHLNYENSTSTVGESTVFESTSNPTDETTSADSISPNPFTTSGLQTVIDTKPIMNDDKMESISIISDPSTDNEEYYDGTTVAPWQTNEVSTAGPRRIKRMLQMVLNDTHCFHIVCSSSSEFNHVTEALNSRGVTETSSYSTTMEHEDAPGEDYSLTATCLSLTKRKRLRKLCWETMFGQELVKLTVMDLVSTIISTIFVDFARAVFVRYMNRCWCWNLEKRYPQYGDFKIAENILHLVNNQGMVWMGMFFSPGLPIINVVKLMIMMYVRSWAVLTCNVPHDVVFRASRSNNFYLGLLLTMLFLCVLPVGYAIVRIEPSWHCGPFSQYKKIYHIFTHSIKKAVPNPVVHRVLDYIASPGIIIPLLLLLILVIYYLASLTSSLREANTDLKIQLRRERTEERRKMFLLVNSKNRGDDNDDDYTCLDSTLSKWRQIMPDNKLTTDGSNFVLGLAEKKNAENNVLDKVREKLVHIETDDLQQSETKQHHGPLQDSQHFHHHRHYLHHHQQTLHHHHHHLRRPSRNEEPRDPVALQRKWKKTKLVVSRLPSSDSEASDQSDVVPEIRVSSSTNGQHAAVEAKSRGLPDTSLPHPSLAPVISDGKQRARLKLAQILYKEARRRRQKYVEELQNQQE